MIKPVFILSLPRSGSTLLQRVIAAHPKVSTVAEPWIQLPLCNMLRDESVFTDYGHKESRGAIKDLAKKLPNEEKDLDEIIRLASLELYNKLSDKESIYFIDKTPRYHLVCHFLARIFPDAKFIILWRNPLAIAASMIETWGKGDWNLFRYKVDLYKGLQNLLAFNSKQQNQISVNYEKLVGVNNEKYWQKIFEFLDMDFDKNYLLNYTNVEVGGRMGDPQKNKYNGIKDNSNKWRKSFQNIIRTTWAKDYLNWIGRDSLSKMNYDYEKLHTQIPIALIDKHLGGDICRGLIGLLKPWMEPYIYKTKCNIEKSKDLLSHS